jgi:hypothetical protein
MTTPVPLQDWNPPPLSVTLGPVKNPSDIARHLMTLPDEEVVLFPGPHWTWTPPTANHLRLAAAIQASQPDLVKILLDHTPALVGEEIPLTQISQSNPEDVVFEHVLLFTPLVVALQNRAYGCAHAVLDSPLVDVNWAGHGPTLLTPLAHALPSHKVFPAAGSEAEDIIRRLLDMGADPLGGAMVGMSAFARTIQGLYHPPRGREGPDVMAGVALFIGVIMKNRTRPDYSPLVLPGQAEDESASSISGRKETWPDFFAGFFQGLNHVETDMGKASDGFGLEQRLARGRRLTGMDFPAWPDMLMAWLIQAGLGREFLEKALPGQTRVLVWMEQQWLQETLSQGSFNHATPSRL